MLKFIYDYKDVIVTFTAMLSLLISLVSFIATFIVKWFEAKKKQKKERDTARLNDIIIPIYNLIKHDMYQQISEYKFDSILSKSYQLTKDHFPETQDFLEYIEHIKKMRTDKKEKRNPYVCFCNYINAEYDSLARKLGLPVRSYDYRKKNAQYSSKWHLFALYWSLLWENIIKRTLGILALTIVLIVLLVAILMLGVYLTLYPQIAAA